MTDPEPLAVCRDLARTFGQGENAVVAVHGATCTVNPTDRIALVGPSGSGKSTLLHCLADLDRPTSGTIAWPSLPTEATARRSLIRVVFQGASLVASLDVIENVALALVLNGVSDREARSRALLALERLGLGALAAKLPDELSGGQAQRVAVARAEVSRPRLLLADEPTGQLDHDAAMLVVSSLIDASARTGCGLIVTTHDPDVADRFDRRWAMVDGRLQTEEVLACSR